MLFMISLEKAEFSRDKYFLAASLNWVDWIQVIRIRFQVGHVRLALFRLSGVPMSMK